MTLADFKPALERARAVLASPWGWVIALAVACALLVAQCNGRRAAEANAAREAEAGKLAKQGLVVAEQQRGDLEGLVADLKGQIEAVKRATPGAQVVAVEQLSTGRVAAAGAPRAAPPAAACPPAPPCLLAAGDTGELRMEGAHLDTRAGNTVVVARLAALRLLPEPQTLILEGEATAPVSRAVVEPPAPPPGWGFGGAALAIGREWAAGPVVAAPPLRVPLVGGRLEFSGGVGYGSAFGGQVTAIYRR